MKLVELAISLFILALAGAGLADITGIPRRAT